MRSDGVLGITARTPRTKLEKLIKQAYPAAAPHVPKDAGRFSTLFGDSTELPRGPIGEIALLWLHICGPDLKSKDAASAIHALTAEHRVKGRQVLKSSDAAPIRVELCIPPALDAILLVPDCIVGLEEGSSGRRRSRTSVDTDPTGVLLEAPITRTRYAELVADVPDGQRRSSRLFYVSWQRALDAQDELNRRHVDDPILVLDKWMMAATPSYCLLQAGEPGTPRWTLLERAIEEGEVTNDAPGRRRWLADKLNRHKTITTKETTSERAFRTLLEELNHDKLLHCTTEPVVVSFMTVLTQLLSQRAIPSDWIVVGGPPQYWTVLDQHTCSILDASQPDAKRVSVEDKLSFYVIATRRRYLHPADPDGVQAGAHFRQIGTRVREQFNSNVVPARDKYRAHIAERLRVLYDRIEGPRAGMSKEGIIKFIDRGMQLSSEAAGGFVPLRDFKPPTVDRR